MHKISVYHCDYCNKMLVNSTQMKKHEKNCFHNPNSHSCITCNNLYQGCIEDGKTECKFGTNPFECESKCKGRNCIVGIESIRCGKLKTHCDKWSPIEIDYENIPGEDI